MKVVLVVVLFFLIAFLILPAAQAACPSDDVIISSSTTLDGGFCTVSDTNLNGALIITGSNLILDCNGMILNGTVPNAIGINAIGVTNVTIKNCGVKGFGLGMNLTAATAVVEQFAVSESDYGIHAADTTLTLRNALFNTSSDLLFLNTTAFFSNVSYTTLQSFVYPVFSVIDNTGAVVPSPNVQIRDVTGALVSNTTYPSGTTLPIKLKIIHANSSANLSANPFSITAIRSGFSPVTSNITILTSDTVQISLIRIDNIPPNVSFSLDPPVPSLGSPVFVRPVAEENTSLSSLNVYITYPNNSVTILPAANNSNASFTPVEPGVYNITAIAKDFFGNTGNATQLLTIGQKIIPTFKVSGPGNTPQNATLSVTYANTNTIVATPNLSAAVILSPGIYDLLFSSYAGRFIVKLKGVSLSQSSTTTVGLDKPIVAGYKEVYAVFSPFPLASATVTIRYTEALYPNESIVLLKCSNWNFDSRSCNSGWENISFVQNKADNTLTVSTLTLSAFALKQPDSCGDNFCGETESVTTCLADCQCSGGETRVCGVSALGACRKGIQTCTDGSWSACAGEVDPANEACNGIDDDCDGVVDNIGGNAGITATQCQCFAGALPVAEQCNNIDDNCNSLVDDGLQRQCGAAVGVCTIGTSVCAAGQWSACTGGIQPRASEICDNELDDDCNGQTDDACGPAPFCPEGAIISLCSCGGSKTSSGYCCNSRLSETACPSIDATGFTLSAVVIIILIALAAFFVWQRRKKGWSEVSQRYSYSPA